MAYVETIRTRSRKYCTMTSLTTGVTSVKFNSSGTNDIFSTMLSGVQNPNWKVKVAKKQDASTPYQRSGGTAWSTSLVGSGVSASNRYEFFGNDPPPSPPAIIPSDSGYKNLAITRFKRKLGKSIGQAALQAPIAECRELHGLIRQATSIGTRALQTLIDIRRTKGKSALRFAGDTWLGYSFGVSPIISDINKSIVSVQDYLSRDDHFQRITASATKEWHTLTRNTRSVQYAGCTNVNHDDRELHLLQYRYVGGVDLKIRSGNNYTAVDHLGLGVDNIPGTLWELTAFSWLVDYFSNVGAYLDDIFYTLPGDLRYLNLDTRYMYKGYRKPTVHNCSGQTYWLTTAKEGGTEYYNFKREVLAALPHIGLRIKSRDEIGLYGVNKLLNLASILVK